MDKKEETPQGCTIMSKKHGQKGGNYMQLYPAIDMKGGKCVRLTQGLFDNVKVYSKVSICGPINLLPRLVGAINNHLSLDILFLSMYI